MAGQNGTCPICQGRQWLAKEESPGHYTMVPCTCYLREFTERRKQRLLAGMRMPPRLQEKTFDNFHPEWAVEPVIPPGLLKSRKSQDQERVKDTERKQTILAQHYHGKASLQLAKIKKRCWEYAKAPQGWLTLVGEVGCGKTHLAAAIANYQAQAENGLPAIFAVVPDLLDHLRATFHPKSSVTYDERFEALCEVPLLILDDLGTQNATEWAGEKLYQICNYRYNHQLPTVITTNNLAHLEPRIASRATERGFGEIWEILAGDLRQHLQK